MNNIKEEWKDFNDENFLQNQNSLKKLDVQLQFKNYFYDTDLV